MYSIAFVVPGLTFRRADGDGRVIAFPSVNAAQTVIDIHERLFGYRGRVERWSPNRLRYEVNYLPEEMQWMIQEGRRESS